MVAHYHKTIEIDIEAYRSHAIEVRSLNTPAQEEARIRELARRLGLSLLWNSDAHRAEDVGRYYNELPHQPEEGYALAQMLKASLSILAK